ncbi:MAG: hypothetical protein KJ749_07825 [Planctomycetes bacterium]|nr:hypothetical protein [Planctomycetota bacterium]
MRGKGRYLFVIGVSLLAAAAWASFCVQVFAQSSDTAAAWRPIAQKRVVQAILAFTTLGMCFIAALGAGIGGLALQLWARTTFPKRTAAVLTALEEKRWKSFLVGLVNLTFLGALFAVCANVRVLGSLAIVTVVVAFAFVFLGLLGRAERLGTRILTAAGRTPNSVANILVGWPVLYFVVLSLVLIPLLGWALLLYLLLSGTGAAVLSLVAERKAPPAGPEESA